MRSTPWLLWTFYSLLFVCSFALEVKWECTTQASSSLEDYGEVWARVSDLTRIKANAAVAQGTIQEDKIPVIHTFMYNGEPIVLFNIRYIYDFVDCFIIVESWITFSGLAKEELFFERNKAEFEPFMDKITYIVLGADDFPPPSNHFLQTVGDNTVIRMHDDDQFSFWYRDFYARDSAQEYVRDAYSGQRYILISTDGDEIPHRNAVQTALHSYSDLGTRPAYLAMEFFYYNFGWKKKFLWDYAFVISDLAMSSGIGLSEYRFSKQEKLHIVGKGGWHCSYFETRERIREKIESFSHKEYNKGIYKTEDHLDDCFVLGRDIFVRGVAEDLEPTAFGDASNLLGVDLPTGWQELQRELVQAQQRENKDEACI